MYKKLLSIVEQRTNIEAKLDEKKTAFAEANSVLIAQLDDLKEKEVLLREEALLALEKEEKSSVEVENKVIYSQVRVTKSVGDADALDQDLLLHGQELANNGINAERSELFGTETVVKDKKTILVIAQKYNQLTGKELNGIAVKETKFLTIKEK